MITLLSFKPPDTEMNLPAFKSPEYYPRGCSLSQPHDLQDKAHVRDAIYKRYIMKFIFSTIAEALYLSSTAL
jgi:hypothetical protein